LSVPQPLPDALDRVRRLLLDREKLVRAVASGRRRTGVPSPARAELTPVALKGQRRIRLTTSDGVRPTVRNLDDDYLTAVDELLNEPFGNWHVETADETVQLRVTKRGEALVHTAAARRDPTAGVHDRPKEHLIPPDDPLFDVIGGNAAKRRQVDAFLRALDATVDRPRHVVDLGCGNAYLTFAAYRYLSERDPAVTVTGVDVRVDQRDRNTALAKQLGWANLTFVADSITAVALSEKPDLVLALHACDTATDDALARAVEWNAHWILAAPCCHHDVATQLKNRPHPLTRHGILRERFADVLTDALRAEILGERGYRVEVVEFIDSAHTPRNALIKATRGTGNPGTGLAREWGVRPYLETLLTPPAP
jgi:SAM-dependent methyltransferase